MLILSVKKSYLKNTVTILLITFFLSGNSGGSVYCVSESDCCKTACCNDNIIPADAEQSLCFNKTDCCEFTASSGIQKQYAATFHKTLDQYLPSVLYSNINLNADRNFNFTSAYQNPVSQSHSKVILRI